jgi:hypothetical protein
MGRAETAAFPNPEATFLKEMYDILFYYPSWFI